MTDFFAEFFTDFFAGTFTAREAYIWLGIAGLMGVTFLARSGLILLKRDIQLPMRVQRALRFAPMAAIVAIIMPSVLLHQGQFSVAITNPKILAVIAAMIAWKISKQMGVCLLAGLAVYVAMRL
jgi:branched-subunit amino acid transport protein